MKKLKYIIQSNLEDPNATFRYFIEGAQKIDDDIDIKGWVVSSAGTPVKIDVVAEGNAIEGSNTWRHTRPDVADALGIEEEWNAGFEIRFERDSVQCDKVQIVFSEGSDKECNADSGATPLPIDFDLKKFDFSVSFVGRTVNFMTDDPVRRIKNRLKSNKGEGEMNPLDAMYKTWRDENKLTEEDLKAQREAKFDYNPLISIAIPLYNTKIEFLKPLMDGIVNQTYTNFELCLADGSDTDYLKQYIDKNYPEDNRIKYIHLDENLGISGNTNKAIAMATGDYIMLTDHDDLLEVNALYEIVKALNEDKDIDIVYTDEDLVDETGTHYWDYKFKPEYNLEMLRHRNYICHIFVARKSIMDEVGGFREEYDGAQDFDMILRCCEKSDNIIHVPKVLYHWRSHIDSTAGNADSKSYAFDASVRALKAHYERVGIDAKVEPTEIFIMLKTTRKLKATPLVSIIIPNKDHIDELDKCIKSIIDKTEYKNYEIIIVENNSEEDSTFDYYKKIESEYNCIKVCYFEGAFNFSKINNFGVNNAKGEHYIFLNNDVEIISPDWINRMLGYSQDENVGAVGAKLLYPDDTVQHCGVVVGIAGFAGHVFHALSKRDVGYFGRLRVQQEVSAVTAACMMVDAKVYEDVGGFDEDFAVALNDVDLCLKIRDKDKKIILDPNVLLYHYESKSRGSDEDESKKERFLSEVKRFRSKWKDFLEKGDPYYSPNLTLTMLDCSPRRADERFEIVEEIDLN